MGKGNLVNAQIIAFLNSTLDCSATVAGSVGTGTSATYSYKYGAYLYYNLGYGVFANILGDTWNWHFTPVFLYGTPSQKYTIYENSNVDSDATLISKRDVKILPDDDEKGLFHDDEDEVWDNGDLEPYVPPASHLHHRRSHIHLDRKVQNCHHEQTNATSVVPYVSSMIFRRDDGDTDMPDAADTSQFTGHQNFQYPPSGKNEPTLPELRCMYQMFPCFQILSLTVPDNCQSFSSNQVVSPSGQTKLARGICDGILAWFSADGASSDGVTLIWDPNRRDERDKYTCNAYTGGTYCTQPNQIFNAIAGLNPPKQLVSCDEFPFGGAEEGGDWGAKYAPRKRPPTAKRPCVATNAPGKLQRYVLFPTSFFPSFSIL